MPNYQKLFLKMILSSAAEFRKGNSGDRSSIDSPQARGSQSPASQPVESNGGVSRRRWCGGVAAVLLSTAVAAHWTGLVAEWTGSESTSVFLVSALTRIGMVFAALWLAWDSLRRPARWLPPGLAVLGVVSVVVVTAQPKLIIAILPLVGIVTVLASVLRVFRKGQ